MIPTIDNTTLNNLSPNLDVGDVANPALRLAYFQYINSFLTTVINKLNSVVPLSSGSESIGSAPITGVTGATVYAQLVSLQANIQTIIGGSIPPSSVNTAMIQDVAVTFAKLAPNVKTGNRGGKLYQYKNQGGL